jgi:hypothetical protein
MFGSEITPKLAELDQLLNDPEVRMDPHRVWALVQELKAPMKRASATHAQPFGR